MFYCLNPSYDNICLFSGLHAFGFLQEKMKSAADVKLKKKAETRRHIGKRLKVELDFFILIPQKMSVWRENTVIQEGTEFQSKLFLTMEKRADALLISDRKILENIIRAGVTKTDVNHSNEM